MENRNWRQNSAPKRTIISSAQGSDGRDKTEPLQCLNSKQIAMIDEALQSVGDFGEVRLIIEKGRLRFLITQVSYDALKWQPGVISE
jgi:hypothetical protein